MHGGTAFELWGLQWRQGRRWSHRQMYRYQKGRKGLGLYQIISPHLPVVSCCKLSLASSHITIKISFFAEYLLRTMRSSWSTAARVLCILALPAFSNAFSIAPILSSVAVSFCSWIYTQKRSDMSRHGSNWSRWKSCCWRNPQSLDFTVCNGYHKTYSYPCTAHRR